MAFPVDGCDALAERRLLLDGHAQPAVVEAERLEDLVVQVAVDGPAVDPLDDGAEDLPTAERVVRGTGARLPFGRMRDDPGDGLRVGDVDVVNVAAPDHREPAHVGEHVTHGAALLAGAPSVDVLADAVVETEAASLPELEHGHGRHGLARRVPEHEVVGRQRPVGARLAHREIEEHLAVQRHVALGAVVPVVGALPLEQLADA